MAVYVVTWELNREKPNYGQARAAFISHLQKFEHTKDQGLDSAWFISTTSSADEVDSYLRQKLDDNDRLLVAQLYKNGNHQGWLAKAVWEWINARL